MSLVIKGIRLWNNALNRPILDSVGIVNINKAYSVIRKDRTLVVDKDILNSGILSQLSLITRRQFYSCATLNEQEHFRKSESAAYDASGKTTVTILNEDVQYIMIDSFSLSGFRLNTGLKAYGPLVVFPNAVLSWRVMDILEVNERSLSLFTILEPKPDIVFIGYGDKPIPLVRSARVGYDLKDDEREKIEEEFQRDIKRRDDVAKHIAKLTLLMKQKKLNLECLPTEDAIASYNYLVSEDRLVAAALIPPNVVKMVSDESTFSSKLAHGEDPWFVTRSQMFGADQHSTIDNLKDLKKELLDKPK